MSSFNSIKFPADIQKIAEAVIKYDATRAVNMQPNEKICKERLRLALWICRYEGLTATEDNLAAILGNKLREVMPFLDEVKKESKE